MQKISSFHLLILEILEPCDQTSHTNFWPCPLKKFLINFYQKIRLFHWFVLEIWLIKNILQSDWLRMFWLVSQEQHSKLYKFWFQNKFSKITKFPNKLKNPVFGPFSGKNVFSRKYGSAKDNFIWSIYIKYE